MAGEAEVNKGMSMGMLVKLKGFAKGIKVKHKENVKLRRETIQLLASYVPLATLESTPVLGVVVKSAAAQSLT